MEIIMHEGKTHAVIIRANFNAEGIKFFTPNDHSFQLGYMNRPKDYVIAPHLHKEIQRTINTTSEVLFIKSGKIRVSFFDESKNFLAHKTVSKGDILLLISGGHGFEFLEQGEIFEVKQGPYLGESEKERF